MLQRIGISCSKPLSVLDSENSGEKMLLFPIFYKNSSFTSWQSL